MWDEIWRTMQSEFSDLPDAAGVTRLTMRLVHMLVALASAPCGAPSWQS